MTTLAQGFMPTDGTTEVERQRLQASVWEPEAEAMLQCAGVGSGWSCIDLGCGAVGILGPLSRQVGRSGQVLGMDLDATQVKAARTIARAEGWENVEVCEG